MLTGTKKRKKAEPFPVFDEQCPHCTYRANATTPEGAKRALLTHVAAVHFPTVSIEER